MAEFPTPARASWQGVVDRKWSPGYITIMLNAVSPEQLRAARALLGLDQMELARRARVSVVTVRRAESSGTAKKAGDAIVWRIRAALEEAGVEFIANGVRAKAQPRANAAERIRRVREITERSAKLFKGKRSFTEDDLYDENGLPA